MELDAIGQRYSELGPNFERLGSLSGLYLCYNGEGDWSIVQLDCIQLFFRWLFCFYSSTHLFTVAKGLSETAGVPVALRNKVIACWANAYPAIECPLPMSSIGQERELIQILKPQEIGLEPEAVDPLSFPPSAPQSPLEPEIGPLFAPVLEPQELALEEDQEVIVDLSPPPYEPLSDDDLPPPYVAVELPSIAELAVVPLAGEQAPVSDAPPCCGNPLIIGKIWAGSKEHLSTGLGLWDAKVRASAKASMGPRV